MTTSAPRNKALEPFAALIGRWKIEGKHPLLPGRILHGEASFTWLDDGAFVNWRTSMDDPEMPDGVAIFGSDDERGEYFMIYFDERGVSRRYDVAVDGKTIRWWRDAPALSQRYTWTIAGDGRTVAGKGEMSRNGSPWEGDLETMSTRI